MWSSLILVVLNCAAANSFWNFRKVLWTLVNLLISNSVIWRQKGGELLRWLCQWTVQAGLRRSTERDTRSTRGTEFMYPQNGQWSETQIVTEGSPTEVQNGQTENDPQCVGRCAETLSGDQSTENESSFTRCGHLGQRTTGNLYAQESNTGKLGLLKLYHTGDVTIQPADSVLKSATDDQVRSRCATTAGTREITPPYRRPYNQKVSHPTQFVLWVWIILSDSSHYPKAFFNVHIG